MNFLHTVCVAPFETLMRVLLDAFFHMTGSYGTGLILTGLTVNILLIPLYLAAERMMIAERNAVAAMKKDLAQIRRAFCGRERWYMLRTLYRQHGYHPIMALRAGFGLCLQIPVFLAAYGFLNNNASLDNTSFLFLKNLAAPDGLLFGANLLPFFMTAASLSAAYVYGRDLSTRDRIVLYLLSAAFLVVLYDSPSGLVLYWTCNSLFFFLRSAFRKPSVARRSPYAALYVKTCLLLGILIFLYNPILLVQNSYEFYSPEIADFLLQSAVIAAYVMFAVFIVAKPGWQRSLAAVVCVLAIMAFAYNIFAPADYGVLEISVFQHEDRLFQPWHVFIDVLVCVAIVAICLACFIYKPKILHSLVSFMILASVFMSAWTFANIRRDSGHVPAGGSSYQITLSEKDMNVIVFVLDMFTGAHMENVMADKRNLLKHFDGFIWYSDTVSAGNSTLMSMPSILAGERLVPENHLLPSGPSLEDRTDMELRRYYSSLENRGFSPRIFWLSPDKIDFMKSNEYLSQPDFGRYDLFSQHLKPLFLCYGLFKSLPMSLRPFVYRDGRWLFVEKDENYAMMSFKKWQMLKNLSLNSRVAKWSGRTYTFIYSDLTHHPWSFDEKTLLPARNEKYFAGADGVNSTRLYYTERQMRGGVIPQHLLAEKAAIQLLDEYFLWMQKHNVYNSSCIVILSDHDDSDSLPLSRTFGNPNPTCARTSYPGRPDSLLLVKYPHAHGPLKKDDSLMATQDVRNIVNAAINGERWSPPHNRIRRHAMGGMSRHRHAENHYLLHEFWEIRGNKLDRKNWQKLPIPDSAARQHYPETVGPEDLEFYFNRALYNRISHFFGEYHAGGDFGSGTRNANAGTDKKQAQMPVKNPRQDVFGKSD